MTCRTPERNVSLIATSSNRNHRYRQPSLWDRLTEPQRIDLTRHEVAGVASLGIWFETILMQLLVRDYRRQDPTAAHAQYALTEIADERCSRWCGWCRASTWSRRPGTSGTRGRNWPAGSAPPAPPASPRTGW